MYRFSYVLRIIYDQCNATLQNKNKRIKWYYLYMGGGLVAHSGNTSILKY